MSISQRSFTSDWFQKRPNQIFSARVLRERLASDYETLTGKVFGDPEKMVRMLFQEKFIERPYDGHYVFSSDNDLYSGKVNFTKNELIEILERDNFRCVICMRGEKDGIHVSVGFAKSLLLGGLPVVENGKTFCQRHKFISEVGQTSHSRSAQLRRLNALLPLSDKGSAGSQTFWEDLIDLLGKYGVTESQIYKEDVAE